ncbi:MAG: ABC transporter substrate-binding protein [Candidatus Cloacimonadota bacterium]|nr:ABC transporter substrate-binding protein [Candidatus Cloacimonadota bacterium]
MKKVLFVTLISLMFVISACGKKEQTSDKTTIEFWHAMGGPLGDALTIMIDEFNNTHDDIYLKAISMGRYEALSQKLMAAIVANTQPDMAQAHENWTAKLIGGKAIIPIEKFINGKNGLSKEELEDFYPVFIKSSTFGDTMWAFPFNKSVRVMYYNKDMFYKNGLDINKPPETWDDFINICKILTQDANGDGKIDQWGTTFATSVWQFLNLLLEAGGKIINEDQTKSLLNSKYGIMALNYLDDLLHKYRVAYLSTGYDGQNDFLASKVGLVEGSSVSMVYLQKDGSIPFNIGISAIPHKKTKHNLISGTNVVIFRNDKDKESQKRQEACWKFIKWFTSPEKTAQWANLTYYMPVRKSALNDPQLQEKFKKYPGLRSVFNQLEFAEVPPQLSAWFETRDFIAEEVLENVFRKQLTPQKALDKASKHFQEALDE